MEGVERQSTEERSRWLDAAMGEWDGLYRAFDQRRKAIVRKAGLEYWFRGDGVGQRRQESGDDESKETGGQGGHERGMKSEKAEGGTCLIMLVEN